MSEINMRGLDESMPIGAAEIATLFGVKVETVYQWRTRGALPLHDWPTINGNRAWKLGTVLAWGEETGRDPVGLDNLAGEYLPEGWKR